MNQILDFDHLYHELKTGLNHIIGFCDIISIDAKEFGKIEILSGIDQIIQRADKINRLLTFHFEKTIIIMEELRFEEIGKSILIHLRQIINDSQGMLILFKNHAPFFSPDMEQLLTVTSEMYNLIETKLIDLQVLETTGNSTIVNNQYLPLVPSQAELVNETDLASEDIGDMDFPIIPVKILVIDDNITYHRLITRQLISLGHSVQCVDSGIAALQLLSENPIDLIILDVLMPGMSGYDILRLVKQNDNLNTIPVIMISAMDSSTSIAKCIKLGAEDYLPKDFDPIILRARLNACIQKKLLQEQQNIFINALVKSQQNLENELTDAAKYIVSLLPLPINQPIKAAVGLIPSARLGGDFCAFHWLDSENLAIYLLDVSGHGIKSALLAVSLSNTLRTKGLPNTNFFNPGIVLTSLNQSFQANDNQSVFFSLWYGVLNLKSGSLQYACGGSPPACVIRKFNPAFCEILEGRDLVLGAAEEYQYLTRHTKMEKGDRLILYSDGLYEITRRNGTILGLAEFQNILPLQLNEPATNIKNIIQSVLTITNCDAFQDDICLLEMQF